MKKRALYAGLVACASVMGTWTMDVRAEDEPSAVSANVAVVSDYRFRGIAQTDGKPALQGGFDYEHASGWNIGVWGSSISWLSDLGGDISSNVELDVYAGYTHETASGVTLGASLTQYLYPGSYPAGFNDADTLEGAVSVGWGPLSLSYAYAFTDLFGYVDSDGSGYLSLGWEQSFGEGWTVSAHYGQQSIKGAGNAPFEYDDWSLGVSKDLPQGFALALTWTDTNAKRALYTNAFGTDLGGSALVFSASRTF